MFAALVNAELRQLAHCKAISPGTVSDELCKCTRARHQKNLLELIMHQSSCINDTAASAVDHRKPASCKHRKEACSSLHKRTGMMIHT